MADAQTISVLIKARDEASAALNKVQTNGEKLASSFMKHRTTIAAAAAGIGMAIGGVGVFAVKAASDVEEMRNKFSVVFRGMENEIEGWAKTHSELIGRSRFDLMGYAANLQDTLVPMGIAREEASRLARQVVELSIDLGSFNNLRTEDVIRDMTSALIGNTESVLKYGVVIKAANIDQAAMNMGFADSKASIDAAAKAQTILQLVLAGTTDAHGDAERSVGSFAAEMLRLDANIKEVKVTIGEVLLPIVTSLIEKITPLVKQTKDWTSANPELTGTLVKLTAILGTAAIATGTFLLVLPGLNVALGFLTVQFGGLTLAMGPIAAIIMGIYAAVMLAIVVFKNWDKIVNVVKKTVAAIGSTMLSMAISFGKATMAVLKLIPGLKVNEEKFNANIKALQKLKIETDNWGKSAEINSREANRAFEETEDTWTGGSGRIIESTDNQIRSNENLSESHRDIATSMEAATGRMSYAANQQVLMAQDTAGVWRRVADTVMDAAEDEAQGYMSATEKIRRSLDERQTVMTSGLEKSRAAEREAQQAMLGEWEKTQEALAEKNKRLKEDWAKVGEAFDETLNKWKDSSFQISDVVAAWATAMNTSTEAVQDRLAGLSIETSDVHAILRQFALDTGHDFFEWAEKTGIAIDKSIAKLSEFEKLTGMKSPLHGMTRDIDKEGLTYEERLAERRKGTMFDPAVKKAFDAVGVESSDFADYAREAIRKGGGADIFGSQKFGRTITDEEGRKITAASHSITSGVSANDIRRAANAAMNAGEDPFKAAVASAQAQQTAQFEEIAEKGLNIATHTASGVPMRANGGFASGLTVVGERGPELVSLPGGSFVHPNGTGPGGVVNQFHFHGAVYGVEDLKEAVVEAVRDHAISGGFSGVFAEA